jgi:HSP20 family protein
MAAWPATLLSTETEDLSEDVRRVFEELQRQRGRPPGVAGQCSPPLDMFETDETVELLVDLPGVGPDTVRVVLKGSLVLIAGEKPSYPPAVATAGDYHLVERSFGRFARVVRVATPFDGSRGTAAFVNGTLRIVLPKIHDRRGRSRPLAIDDGHATS